MYFELLSHKSPNSYSYVIIDVSLKKNQKNEVPPIGAQSKSRIYQSENKKTLFSISVPSPGGGGGGGVWVDGGLTSFQLLMLSPKMLEVQKC